MSQQVNGYYCRNCTEVELAKRHLDPKRPNPNLPQTDETTRRVVLGENHPSSEGSGLGTRLNLRA
jgi:hypothetical protein